MRNTLLFALLAATTACGTIRKTFGLRDPGTPHREPGSTSVWGDWVLATPADSTAFVGAERVEMNLAPGSFTIVATYPGGPPVRVTGGASLAETSLLTLTPTSSLGNAGNSRAMPLSAGQAVTVRVSAAGGAIVFAPPREDNLFPSSVWHKRAAAVSAGTIAPPDSARR